MNAEYKRPTESMGRKIGSVALKTAHGYLPDFFHDQPTEINQAQQVLRLLTEAAMKHVYKSDIVNPERIFEAENLLATKAGLIIVANHFSKRDTVQIYQIPFASPYMRKANITTAIAEHQKKWYFGPLHHSLHNDLAYIPTEETERQYAEKNKTVEDKNSKMKNYISTLLDVFNKGDIAIVFPQGSRKSSLHDEKKPNPSTISSIYRSLAAESRRRGEPTPKFGIMFLGFEPQTDKPYEELKDSTIKDVKYTINVGHTYSIDQLLKMADNNPKKLDEVVYKQLETLVSPGYIGKNSNQEANPSETF